MSQLGVSAKTVSETVKYTQGENLSDAGGSASEAP